ncbi:hypothetical protein PUN28_005056 [Cardiocondyla obscurior]|uniref:Odorant receptor n=1 Tax=Cardiocondyla obscurior TaxID=286306 RepID=A0AAW2GIV9_9HYME
MRLIEKHYYTINKSFLKALGIWPHNNSQFISLLQQLLVLTLTLTYIGMQLLVFTTTKYNMVLFIKVSSFIFSFIVITLKYCTFMLKSKSIQNLHYFIQEDWKLIQNKLEFNIILKYAHNGQFCAHFLFLFIVFVVIALSFMQFLPYILDIVLPLDEPRPRKIIITAEYFDPENKYFVTEALHEILLIALVASIMFATASQLLVFCFHTLGMFQIVSHRIQYSIEDSVLHASNSEKEYAIYKRVVQAVIAHRRTMEFFNILISSFNVPYCIIAIIGLISLSVNLYGLVEAIMISKNMNYILLYFIMTLNHLIYMFVTMTFGQKVNDSNNELFTLLYNTSWYMMPLSSQKLILFLLQKTGKELYAVVGMIIVAKMETFASVRNAKN